MWKKRHENSEASKTGVAFAFLGIVNALSVNGFAPPCFLLLLGFLDGFQMSEVRSERRRRSRVRRCKSVKKKERLLLSAHSRVNNSTALMACTLNGIAILKRKEKKTRLNKGCDHHSRACRRPRFLSPKILSRTSFLHQNVRT